VEAGTRGGQSALCAAERSSGCFCPLAPAAACARQRSAQTARFFCFVSSALPETRSRCAGRCLWLHKPGLPGPARRKAERLGPGVLPAEEEWGESWPKPPNHSIKQVSDSTRKFCFSPAAKWSFFQYTIIIKTIMDGL